MPNKAQIQAKHALEKMAHVELLQKVGHLLEYLLWLRRLLGVSPTELTRYAREFDFKNWSGNFHGD